MIAAGYSSNYGKRMQASRVYLTGTLEAAIRGAEWPPAETWPGSLAEEGSQPK